MESLYFLIPCALIFIAIAVKVLLWAINNGQYDNLDTEASRILFEDNSTVSSTKKTHTSSNTTSTTTTTTTGSTISSSNSHD